MNQQEDKSNLEQNFDQKSGELNEEKINETEPSVDDLWEEIGFHKPMAGFFYSLTFSIFGLLLGLMTTGIITKIFYPFPESSGYRTTTAGLFVLFFSIFDLGTHMTMDRFIAETAINNPEKMLNYIQYFVWYQALTGLLQTTAVSVYALFIIPSGDLAYGVWLMLIVSTTQYPGMLGVFSGVLGSLQKYNKKALLDFIASNTFSKFFELAIVWWGREWGRNNPEIGEIMGIAIGAGIGLYIDDFFNLGLASIFFSRAMKDKGIRPIDCFRIEFDWKLVKECMIFGVKTGTPSLIGVFVSLIILTMYLDYIPQYTTFAALSTLMGGVAGFVNYGGITAPTPLIAESYLNDKKELTQFYIAQSWRYIFIFQMLFIPVTLMVFTIVPLFFEEFGLENYLLAIPFFIPSLIRQIQQPLTSLADTIQLGTNHPNFLTVLRFTEELLKIVFTYLWVVTLALPEKYGINAMIWIFPCGIYPAIMFKTISAYIYIHKKIIPLKINKYQTFFVPITSGAIMYGVLYLLTGQILPFLLDSINFYVAIVLLLFMLITVILYGYFPLTVILGGWDKQSLKDLEYAAKMSGPSKFYVMPLYRLINNISKKSKLHDKYPIPYEIPTQQAQELYEEKMTNLMKMKEQIND